MLKPDEREFVQGICAALDQHLHRQEQERDALSILASGAAFEAWLAFEARLALESSPGVLPVDRFSVENERGKSDVYISDWKTGSDTCHALIEFKLVYNNKNWGTQVQSVFNDLYPTRTEKRLLSPTVPRVALVGLIGKLYLEGGRYPGPRHDIKEWEREVFTALEGGRGHGAELVWSGRRMALQHEWLDPNFASFFQLHAFTPVFPSLRFEGEWSAWPSRLLRNPSEGSTPPHRRVMSSAHRRT
ncbi:hypothetical protein [Corallococcus terminator]|uniref:hypothetical protein n=1 Tax=Corallococcus terminator TaxID=2316733 RepID=UPI0011C4A172|nr:hypothetical protein [Corallococcus terminator]